MAFTAEQVINGTYGEVWLNGDKVAEAYGLRAEIQPEKDDVPICGRAAIDEKTMGYKGKGSVKLYHVYTRFAEAAEQLKKGINPRFQILSVLKDPAAVGAERVLLKNVSFDKFPLADWEAKKRGEFEVEFTFTDWEYLDKITPR